MQTMEHSPDIRDVKIGRPYRVKRDKFLVIDVQLHL